jgi:putative flippase GtrA
MLVEAAQQGMPIKECDIETIYIEENASSHFRPLIDSLRIYFIFIRFCALSIITAIVDFIVFSISFWCGSTVLMSFCMARIVAGSFNFLVGKRMIFKSRANILPEAIKFALLVFTLMCISYVLVNAMVSVLGLPVLMSKLLAEFGLFLLSFAAQRILVFSRANEAVPAA